MVQSHNEDSHVHLVSQNMAASGGTQFKYIVEEESQESGTSDEVHLEFIEEPCGVPAAYGFGYIEVEFGKLIGPDNRYKILRKLGWGMYSSVWLAEDTIGNHHIAIKILTGSATHLVKEGIICEPAVLRHLSSQGKDMTETHCLSLHSTFIQPDKESGDDEHLCIIVDALGPSIDVFQKSNQERSIFYVKKVLRHVLEGLDYLHSLGIAHTDIQSKNIMIDLGRGTFSFDMKAYIDREPARRHPPERTLGNNEFTRVAVSQPFPISQYRDWRTRSFIIGDFGSAQFIDKQVNNEISPIHVRAPEIVLGLPWNEKVDIWSFGCFAFELLTKQDLFKPSANLIDGWTTEKTLLYQMLSFTNERVPSDRIRASKHAMKYLDPETSWLNDKVPPIEKTFADIVKDIQTPETASSIDGFEILLKKCLRLDPKDRPSAKELLKDRWLTTATDG